MLIILIKRSSVICQTATVLILTTAWDGILCCWDLLAISSVYVCGVESENLAFKSVANFETSPNLKKFINWGDGHHVTPCLLIH